MLLIGLTGGIASGKSAVSAGFEARGVPVIDADVLAREVVMPGTPGLAAVVEHFSPEILTDSGELDRAALRQIIFDTPAQRAVLNGLLHPRIRALAEEGINTARNAGAAYAIHVVPLLVETEQHDHFDRILVVDVPVEVQISRLTARDGITEAAARKILDSQASREQRLQIADDVINNEGSREALEARIDQLHARYLQLAEH